MTGTAGMVGRIDRVVVHNEVLSLTHYIQVTPGLHRSVGIHNRRVRRIGEIFLVNPFQRHTDCGHEIVSGD